MKTRCSGRPDGRDAAVGGRRHRHTAAVLGLGRVQGRGCGCSGALRLHNRCGVRPIRGDLGDDSRATVPGARAEAAHKERIHERVRLRAAELGGLQIQDIEVSSNGGMKVHVERTAAAHGLTKTDGSMRTVPVPGPTASLVRDYLAEHPRADDPTAPLFPGMRLTRPRPTGVRATPANTGAVTTGVEDAPPSTTAKAPRDGRRMPWPT